MRGRFAAVLCCCAAVVWISVRADDRFAQAELTTSASHPVEVRDGLFDFGKDGVGWLELHNVTKGDYVVRLGEMTNAEGHVSNPCPRSSIRAYSVTCRVDSARCVVPLPVDRLNTTGWDPKAPAVRLPSRFPVIAPFRFVEVVAAAGGVGVGNLVRQMVHHPIDMSQSSFACDNAVLNGIYELCKYSILATSFCGLYVDGDRERTPYEADAYINQLGHYVIDPDFRMARATFRHLIGHPTWPTEWKQHMIMIAWTDWMWSGSLELVRESYDVLKNDKLLLDLARADGLVVTGGTRHPSPAKGNDIIDWPICERDGFDCRPVNAVLNAFHYLNLLQMSDLAAALGKAEDARFFRDRAAQVRRSYRTAFYREADRLFADGEGSAHTSLHANAAALAFGLVPDDGVRSVADFLERKGLACSVYFAQYLLEALARAGRDEAVVRLMGSKGDRSWQGMLEQGSTIALEAWNAKVKPNLDWNHAWGTPPLNVLVRHVLGVTPLEPGFARVRICPRAGGLTRVRGRVPTVKGPVVVDVEGERLRVDCPVAARVEWRGKVFQIGAGRHDF